VPYDSNIWGAIGQGGVSRLAETRVKTFECVGIDASCPIHEKFDQFLLLTEKFDRNVYSFVVARAPNVEISYVAITLSSLRVCVDPGHYGRNWRRVSEVIK